MSETWTPRRTRRVRSTAAGLLVGALLLGTGGCSASDDGSLTVTAEFATTSGLFVGNEVGVLGVRIGEVTEIEPKGEIVEVTLRIDDGQTLPETAGAVVMSRSVATDRYVEMTPAFEEGPRLADGARIPLERTRTPIEFDEVLETLRTFSDGLRGPDGNADTLNRLLEVGAGTLSGRGQQFNDTIVQFAAAAEALSGSSDDVAGTITDLDALTTMLAANQETINQFLESVTDATELFSEERENFGDTLVALSDALNQLGQFSVDNRSAIVNTSRGLTRVVENLMEHRTELERTLETLPLAFENVGNTVTDDNRVLVKLPPQYFSPVQPVTEALCQTLAALPLDVCAQLGTSPDLLSLLDDLGELLGGLGG